MCARLTVFTLTLSLLIAAVNTSRAEDKPTEFKSTDAKRAQSKYEREIAAAKKEYEERLAEARKKYTKALEAAKSKAMKSEKLEEAVRINKEIASLEKNDGETGKKEEEKKDPLVGKWKEGDTIFTLKEGGTWVNSKGLSSTWRNRDNILMLTWTNGQVVRFTMIDKNTIKHPHGHNWTRVRE